MGLGQAGPMERLKILQSVLNRFTRNMAMFHANAAGAEDMDLIINIVKHMLKAIRGKSCHYGFHRWSNYSWGPGRRVWKCKDCPASYITGDDK